MMEAEANGVHPVNQRLLYSVVLDLKRMRADGEIMRNNTAAAKENSAMAVKKADECIQAQKDVLALNAGLVARLAAVESELHARNLGSSPELPSVSAPATAAAQPRVLRPMWAYRMQVRLSCRLSFLWSSCFLWTLVTAYRPLGHWRERDRHSERSV